MTKSYTLKSRVDINISDIPKHTIVDSINRSFNVVIKSNGLKVWQYNISDKTYTISYNDIEKDSSKIIINADEVKDFIVEKFGLKYDQVEIDNKFMSYSYKRRSSKYVPVTADFEVMYSPGYNSLSTLVVKPDSVLVSGAKSVLNKIDKVKTKKLEFREVSNSINRKVDLLSPSEKVSLEESQVNLTLEVEKFSENSIFVDIQIINKPDNLELNIFPEKAKVSFLISLKDYEKISKIDFEIVCDYEKRFQDTGIMIPEIQTYPDNILDPKLNIKKVDYLIKKTNE
jgi:hypothetical protein